MDYLKINFDQMRFGVMKTAFESLERGFKKFGIDFYLIGAFARDMWMNHLEDLPERRTTYDVDFSIYVKSLEEFINLKKYLVESEGYILDEEPYRLYSADGTMIDLIPFGGLEKKRLVYLEGNPPMALSVFGNMEVYEHAQAVQVNGHDFKVCTLPGLCILKLISGHEKADRIEKDMGDFYYILENYFDIAGEAFYDGEYDDLIDEEFVPLLSAAKMLGRQMKGIVKDSEELNVKIQELLTKLMEKFDFEEIDQMYQIQTEDEHIRRLKLVSILFDEISTN